MKLNTHKYRIIKRIVSIDTTLYEVQRRVKYAPWLWTAIWTHGVDTETIRRFSSLSEAKHWLKARITLESKPDNTIAWKGDNL